MSIYLQDLLDFQENWVGWRGDWQVQVTTGGLGVEEKLALWMAHLCLRDEELVSFVLLFFPVVSIYTYRCLYPWSCLFLYPWSESQ